MEFQKFPSIPRFSRDIVITEKIDGTNAAVYVEPYRIPYINQKEMYIENDGSCVVRTDNGNWKINAALPNGSIKMLLNLLLVLVRVFTTASGGDKVSSASMV